nr:HNH endonuclease signature motif containing protein [Mycobacterium sp. 1274761.0]
MRRGRFCLDPEAGAYLEILLAKLARPGMCNADDPLPAVDGDPDPLAAAGDTRSTARRNHDALKAAMRALLASGELGLHRGLPVTAIITMTLDQLETASGLAVTGGGSTVPMEVAIAMAAHAHHYLYIYDENCGRPLFLGRSQRLASADQRIVLHAIDAGCTVPGCDQSAYYCEVHHLHDWALGGTTDIDRLTLTCQDGNQSAGPSDEQWQARRRYDEQTLGQTVWHPPKSVDPTRQPRTNWLHRRPKRPKPEPDAA